MNTEGSVFHLVTNTIQELIKHKKRREVSEKMIEKMIWFIENSKMNDEERRIVVLAVFSASKYYLKDYPQNEHQYWCKLINHIITIAPYTGESGCFKSEYFKPVLSHLLIKRPEHSEAALNGFITGKNVMEFWKKNDVLAAELYDIDYATFLSDMINNAKTALVDKKCDTEVRKASIAFIETCLVNVPPQHLTTPTTIGPGILSAVTQCVSETDVPALMLSLVNLFGELVCQIFGDEHLNEKQMFNFQTKRFEVRYMSHRDMKWQMTVAEQLKVNMIAISSLLCCHNLDYIRLAFATMLHKVYKNCQKIFNGCMDQSAIDLYLIMNHDKNKKIQAVVKQIPDLMKDEVKKENIYIARIEGFSTKLKVKLEMGRGSDNAVLVAGSIYGLKEQFGYLCGSRSPLVVNLIRELAVNLKVDPSMMVITRMGPTDSLKRLLKEYPLRGGLTLKELDKICVALAEQGGYDVLDILSTEFQSCAADERIGYIILTAYILLAFQHNSIKLPNLSALYLLTEDFLDILNQLYDKRKQNDAIVEDLSYTMDNDTVMESLLCINLAACVGHFNNRAELTKKLIPILNILLFESVSISWVVVGAAEYGLDVIAKMNNQTRSEMLSMYGSYVVHNIAIMCESSTDYHLAPKIFGAFLDNCEDSKFVYDTIPIVEKLLEALDDHEQMYTIDSLQALVSYAKAINRWLPDMQPGETIDENGEVKEFATPPMQIAGKIMLRSKQMLKSPHLRVRVACLQIINHGLAILQNFDDLLLPMIHQNWESLMLVMKDSEPQAKTEAMVVVLRMAEVSGSFIQAKVLNELYPVLSKVAMAEIRKKATKVYSSDLLLLETIIQSIPVICWRTEMEYDEAEKTYMTILEYGKEAGTEQIQKLCEESIALMDESLKKKDTSNDEVDATTGDL